MKFVCSLLLLLSFSVTASEKSDYKVVTPHEAVAVTSMIELVKTAYQNIGIEIDVVSMPAKRALYEAQKSTWVDGELIRVAAAGQILPDFIRVPVELLDISLMVYTNSSDIQITDWASLAKYRVASLRGLVHVSANIEKYQLHDIQLLTSSEQVFKLLAAERVDIAVIPNLMGVKYINKDANYDFNEQVLERVPLYHFVHKRHQALVPKLTEQLSLLVSQL